MIPATLQCDLFTISDRRQHFFTFFKLLQFDRSVVVLLWRVGSLRQIASVAPPLYDVTARTTASGVRVRTVQVVRRRIAPVCGVMVGLGF